MAVQTAFPVQRRINQRVPDMSYAADVGVDGLTTVDIDVAPVALDADGLLAAQSIASAGSTTTLASTYSQSDGSRATRQAKMGKYGRNVTVVASGAATSTVTITGYDYLGQAMVEVLTLNGNTPVLGVKMFYEVTNIAWGSTGGTTIDVGWGNRFGLPYKALSTQMLGEQVSGATPTAGALVAGVTTQTTTSVDPRGYYTPHSSFLSDASRTYRFTYFADRSNLHGSAHVIS